MYKYIVLMFVVLTIGCGPHVTNDALQHFDAGLDVADTGNDVNDSGNDAPLVYEVDGESTLNICDSEPWLDICKD